MVVTQKVVAQKGIFSRLTKLKGRPISRALARSSPLLSRTPRESHKPQRPSYEPQLRNNSSSRNRMVSRHCLRRASGSQSNTTIMAT